ncbi:hypothetical protein SAY87_014371 [Trapa incisa]|uniref:BHLH domain-containing protein n=1 Tax=Trapa incisa TaxID=236973 RepID=A0AAN7GJZ2_9MYRT|nr:hypothetical protein SAY87_014371 [Trapa incisa]
MMLEDITAGMMVLGQQRTRMRWQGHGDGGFAPLESLNQRLKPDPTLRNLWAELSGVEVGIARVRPGSSNLTMKQRSLKKRKLDRINGTKGDDESKEKKMRGFHAKEEDESKNMQQSSSSTSKGNCGEREEASAYPPKEKSKASEPQKTNYIHVRARRGQATDSHSLAERARREKISERMKYLQDLVPGCNKIIGKAGMLDEIINYVQSLQRQIEFLSMKLANATSRMDWNMDDIFEKEAFLTPCSTSIPSNSASPETASHLNYSQPNPVHLAVRCLGRELGINSIAEHQAPLSSASPIPEMLYDSSIFHQIIPSSLWDADLQNSHNVDFFMQGRATSLASQQLTGSVEISNMKIEM